MNKKSKIIDILNKIKTYLQSPIKIEVSEEERQSNLSELSRIDDRPYRVQWQEEKEREKYLEGLSHINDDRIDNLKYNQSSKKK